MTALVVLLGLALAAAAAALVVVVRRQHVDGARLDALADRLGALADSDRRGRDGGTRPVGAGDTPLDRVEAAVDLVVAGVAADADRRARIEQALALVPEGIVVLDEAGAVVFRNAGGTQVADARHSDALVAAAVDELVAQALAQARGGEQVVDLYGPPRRTVVVTATPLLVEGRARGALAVIEDITERRRLEAVRRDFVANISHELKTPVGALSLLAETLLVEDDPELTRRLAGRMVDEADRVARTIEDLLELSRIEAEEAPVREPVPVHLVVAEAATRIRAAAEHAGIAVDVTEPSHRLVVLGDRRQLVSAIYNLLDNAVKYSDAGSTVEVRCSTDGRTVGVAVTDHGIGIPARDLERVFERFYRVDAARSRRTGGTGLGLAIVRHVAANHAGDVEVASRLGEGSTFTLRFPLATGPVAVDGGAAGAGHPEVESEAG